MRPVFETSRSVTLKPDPLPIITHHYPPLPTITHYCPLLPTISTVAHHSHLYSILTSSLTHYPPLPTITHHCPPLPTITRYSPFPTISHTPPLPTLATTTQHSPPYPPRSPTPTIPTITRHSHHYFTCIHQYSPRPTIAQHYPLFHYPPLPTITHLISPGSLWAWALQGLWGWALQRVSRSRPGEEKSRVQNLTTPHRRWGMMTVTRMAHTRCLILVTAALFLATVQWACKSGAAKCFLPPAPLAPLALVLGWKTTLPHLPHLPLCGPLSDFCHLPRLPHLPHLGHLGHLPFIRDVGSGASGASRASGTRCKLPPLPNPRIYGSPCGPDTSLPQRELGLRQTCAWGEAAKNTWCSSGCSHNLHQRQDLGRLGWAIRRVWGCHLHCPTCPLAHLPRLPPLAPLAPGQMGQWQLVVAVGAAMQPCVKHAFKMWTPASTSRALSNREPK